MAPASSTMMDRLMGILTFKAPVYKEVAEDRTATGTAAMIVIAVAIVVGIVTGILTNGASVGLIVGAIVSSIIVTPIAWFINAWLLAFVAKSFFQGDTDTGEMLRVTGYAAIFRLASIIPIIGGLIALVLGIIANVIGIREAANVDNTKAILIAVIAAVIAFIVALLLAFIIAIPLAAIGFATGAIVVPTPTP
jgi:hypothetical protein